MNTQLRLWDLAELVPDRISDRRIVRYARRYITARAALEGAEVATMLDALRERDACLHDLTLAAGEPCECDAGTCPGLRP